MEEQMRLSATVLAILGVCIIVFAQAEQPGPDYRLLEEDVIIITVAEDENYSMRARIGPDGYIEYPRVGRVHVMGMTVAEVRKAIYNLLVNQQIFKDPTVTVNVETFRRYMATVVGQQTVQRPGVYEFRPGQRIRDLIGFAGGTMPGAADLRKAVLVRKNSPERIPINLRALLQEMREDQNYKLMDGDVLTVPYDEKGYVNVLGYVMQPGTQVYREGMRLTDAIGQARGMVPDVAWTSHVVIRREDPHDPTKIIEIPVNFNKAQRDLTQDVELVRADTVIVPRNNNWNISKFRDYVNTAYVFTILLRADPFDALSNALR
jgi:protein involved in polysaccharide export with SLBB domain